MGPIERTATILAAFSLFTCPAFAEEISLPLTDDALINGNAPDLNYGAEDFLFVHSYGPKESLVLFDAATLAGRTVTEARLELFMTGALEGGALAAHAVTTSWNEGAVTFGTRPPNEVEPAGLTAVTADDAGTVVSIDVTGAVQRWADGTLPAAGFLLTTDEAIRAYFDSKETAGGTPPALVVVADDVPEPPGDATVLDLSTVPMTITTPGEYVLDRNWQLSSVETPGPAISITASDVRLDMQGHEIHFDWYDQGFNIRIEGDNVTIRDGSIGGSGETEAIFSAGRGTTLERLDIYSRYDVTLSGADSSMTDSELITGTGLNVTGLNSTLRSNYVECSRGCLRAGSAVRVLNNHFHGFQLGFMAIHGDGTIFANNIVTQRGVDTSYGISVIGNDNLVLNNLLQFEDVVLGAVIEVDGAGNAIGGNVATANDQGERWGTGIVFRVDGNFYGNNVFAADELVETNGTSQVDWGGNVKL